MGILHFDRSYPAPRINLDGLDKDALRRLERTKNLTITTVQRTLGVGFTRAREIYRHLRRERAHIINGHSYIEWYMTEGKLKWWSENTAALVPVDNQTRKQIWDNEKFRRQTKMTLLTIDPNDNVLGEFVLIKNTSYEKHIFIDLIIDAANITRGARAYILDDEMGQIYAYESGKLAKSLKLNVENFNSAICLTDQTLCATDILRSVARLFIDLSHLYAEKFNPPLEKMKNLLAQFSIYENEVGKFRTIKKDELENYYDDVNNAYRFYEDVYLAFDLDEDVNIIGKCLRAESLKVRGIFLDDGLFCSSLNCERIQCDFIICEEINCDNLSCGAIRTNKNFKSLY